MKLLDASNIFKESLDDNIKIIFNKDNVKYKYILGYNSLKQLEIRRIILEKNGVVYNFDAMGNLDLMILKSGGEDAIKNLWIL